MRNIEGQITMIFEKTDTGFSAFSSEFPIFTTGRTLPELLDNALEASNLYFEDENIEIHRQELKFELDFKQFFDLRCVFGFTDT